MRMHWLKPEPDDYPNLDEGYLDRLAGFIGEAPLRELLADGLIDLSDKLDSVEALAAAGDRAGVAGVAHVMIGIAGHLGLTRLSLAAVDLERAARSDGEPLDPAVRTVTALAAPGLSALARRIDAAAD